MRLLIPLDRSHRDGVVVPYSIRLAKRLRATLTVVHFVPEIRSLLPGAGRLAEAYVDAVLAGMSEAKVEAEGFVGRGDPAPQILQLALDLKADMIIMVTRARRRVGKLMFGSVADTIVGLSPIPVVVVRDNTASALTPSEHLEVLRRAA